MKKSNYSRIDDENQKKEKSLKDRKIIVLGSRHTGKTSIVQRYLGNEFNTKHHPTVFSTYERLHELNGTNFKAKVVDTSGIDKYSNLNSQMLTGVDGYLFVIDLTDEESISDINSINDKIRTSTFANEIPKVLFGNKNDLKEKRKISFESATKFAKQDLKCSYLEGSAKNNENIVEAFTELFRIMPMPHPIEEKTGCCNIL